MSRLRLGDVFEIPTSEGFACFQYINSAEQYGSLIRVFSGVHVRSAVDAADTNRSDVQFLCFFPVKAAVAMGVVSRIGNAEIPPEYRDFPVFRAGVVNPVSGKVDHWWFWDGTREWPVGDLTESQRRMPIRGVWNDTLLVERIESGWRAELDSR